MATNNDQNNPPSAMEILEKVLKGRDIYTPSQLVNLGIYGSKSAVHYALRMKEIECIWVTNHRIVITRDSILRHLKRLNEVL